MNALGCLGWLIVAGGALAALAFLVTMADVLTNPSAETPPVTYLVLALFSLGIAWLGWRLARSQVKAPPPQSTPTHRILALAQKSHGRITLAEVVLNCHLTPDQARELLREMVREGIAELHLSEGGEEVYAFGGFMPETKKTAKDPLE